MEPYTKVPFTHSFKSINILRSISSTFHHQYNNNYYLHAQHLDPEYLQFLEQLAKPVENLPSAEIQLEKRDAQRSGS
jgi:hypothetical protein